MPAPFLADLKPWKFVQPTKVIPDDQYIDLDVLDISSFELPDERGSQLRRDSLPPPLQGMVSRALEAFRTVGFVVIKGHGLSQEDIQHQFDIGKLFADDVAEEEKHNLHAKIKEGEWAGYKPQGYFTRPDGSFDYLEHYDVYPTTAIQTRLPKIAHPLLPDIRRFIEHNHYVVLRKILGIISLGLGLDVDTLWKLHHRGGHDEGALINAPTDHVKWKHTKDHLRYAMYHPPKEDDREKKKHLWLPGHTDSGSVTFLYSQPIAGLQVLTSSGEWRYVRHYPGQIIVDLGDTMEFLTGGVLRASPHRVMEPPEDQRHLDRLGIFVFITILEDAILTPIEHPSLEALGSKDFFEEYYALGGKPFTAEEWRAEKSKLVGTRRVRRERREPRDVLEDVAFRYNPST